MKNKAKLAKWVLVVVILGLGTLLSSYLWFAGGCTPFQATIRSSAVRVIDLINSTPQGLALNGFTPLDLGSKVVNITFDNKLFGYDVDVQLSNGSSTSLKIEPEWRFCVPSWTLPADAFVSDETSQRLMLPPGGAIERGSEPAGHPTKP